MSLRPGSSHPLRLTSPPPSKALLELQKQGLELSVSPPPNTLPPTSNHASGRSTPSDRDKPLPLEPSEGKRRSSSVYSTDTTITNIIHMYGGGCRDLDDIPPLPTLHHPQAYRDTVAPLLIRRLSLSHSPSPPMKDAPREAVSNSSLRSAATYANAVPSNKSAPSFTDFSRQLQQRRNELVSPLSASSAELHRQATYDRLAPPSPQLSFVGQSVSLSQTPPLPDAMSGTISDTDSDLLPPPLGLSSSSLPTPPFDDWEKPAEFDPARHHDPSEAQSQPHGSGKNWSQNWLEDGFVNQSPESSPVELHPRKSFRLRKSTAEKDRERVLSYAETKYPAMKRDGAERKTPRNSSRRSSLQQNVTHLLRSLSRKGVSGGKGSHGQDNPPRERQLAIPATPYQVYGAEIFSDKLQKKQQKEARQAQRTRQRGKSISLVTAYQNSQSQIVGVLEGAKRKLTRKSSQKKRKLKDSIIFVGPSATTGAENPMDQPAVDDNNSWI
ncbi:uncharacterized protein Z520_10745 [Fonsecaea multimorphosa CBS 102226]|uniref:Uncharacterized protein n=1 Tax=Fonsecaea multimorphosa CBS 102226 TaxID=1442371 RepID=A0A0D2JK05_9EURO|nr:uncharacterized protein Z520_10745 [Fonsecaea multimorphosa CBS 102226]KIX93567.1 hypothetical protein Z520_10745 [Fonsecaea multimorphosa CBS 102226]OAL18879.1 hypothetical protein AYO22_10208 [Fonsecaea multimorphosa]